MGLTREIPAFSSHPWYIDAIGPGQAPPYLRGLKVLGRGSPCESKSPVLPYLAGIYTMPTTSCRLCLWGFMLQLAAWLEPVDSTITPELACNIVSCWQARQLPLAFLDLVQGCPQLWAASEGSLPILVSCNHPPHLLVPLWPPDTVTEHGIRAMDWTDWARVFPLLHEVHADVISA